MEAFAGSGGPGLRAMNTRAVLKVLVDAAAPVKVTEITPLLGLTRPTVEAALGDLTDGPWVEDMPPEPTPNRSGRRAKRYRFRSEAAHVMGIDVGPHSVTCLVSDLAGSVVHTEQVRYDDHGDAGTAWSTIQEVVARSIESAGLDRVLAATIGVPAVVGPDGEIAYSAVVPSWLQAGIPRRIQAEFPADATYFDNDVKLATLAESEWGEVVGVPHAIFLLAGHQLGAGLVVNGTLARGANGAAGEIGALRLVDWASAPRQLVAALDGRITPDEIFTRAAAGDPECAAAAALFASDIAEGVAALALAVDPEVIVVAGDAALGGAAFLEPLRRRLDDLCLSTPRLVVSSLGGRSVALGALARSIAHVRGTVLQLPETNGTARAH